MFYLNYRQAPKRLSKLPAGTVGAAPLIVVWLGAGACFDAVCCSAGSLFGRMAPAFGLAVCLADGSFFSAGLVLAVFVGAGFAFGTGGALSVLLEPPRPTIRAIRSITPPSEDWLLDELPLDENRLLNMPPPDDGCADTTGSDTLPVAVRAVAREA